MWVPDLGNKGLYVIIANILLIELSYVAQVFYINKYLEKVNENRYFIKTKKNPHPIVWACVE